MKEARETSLAHQFFQLFFRIGRVLFHVGFQYEIKDGIDLPCQKIKLRRPDLSVQFFSPFPLAGHEQAKRFHELTLRPAESLNRFLQEQCHFA